MVPSGKSFPAFLITVQWLPLLLYDLWVWRRKWVWLHQPWFLFFSGQLPSALLLAYRNGLAFVCEDPWLHSFGIREVISLIWEDCLSKVTISSTAFSDNFLPRSLDSGKESVVLALASNAEFSGMFLFLPIFKSGSSGLCWFFTKFLIVLQEKKKNPHLLIIDRVSFSCFKPSTVTSTII